jgi:predicted Zn finger-like uncharacterized protein
MTMFTRCTHCEATFRVTLEQLQTSSGQVRCGVCHNVFDAFVALSANDPRSGGEPLPREPSAPVVPESPPPRLEEPAEQVLDLELTANDQLPREPDLVVEPEYQPPRAVVEERPASPPPVYYDTAIPRAPERTSLLVAFAVLLLVTLALQGLYIFRADVAAAVPETRPMLEAACAQLACAAGGPTLDRSLGPAGARCRTTGARGPERDHPQPRVHAAGVADAGTHAH